MVPRGRWVQAVMPNGVLSQISQYCVRRHQVDVELDPGLGELALEDLAHLLLPGTVGVAAVDADLEPVRVAGLREQLLRLLDIPLHRREREIFGMDRRHVVVLAHRPRPW